MRFLKQNEKLGISLLIVLQDWLDEMELILSVAAVLFGGGVLGNLIIFFVKRHDEQRANKIALYKELYD